MPKSQHYSHKYDGKRYIYMGDRDTCNSSNSEHLVPWCGKRLERSEVINVPVYSEL
jgi:hypothetical protein